MPAPAHAALLVAAIALSVASGGCATAQSREPARPAEAALPRLHDGRAVGATPAAPLELGELVARAARHDVVLIGELHGHPVGLPWAARFFDAVADHAASDASTRRPALALEFLERDQQPHVDALLAGELAEPAFLAATKLRDEPWRLGHGPMVATARRLGLPVIAANAPRAYTKRARLEGLDALRALPEGERALFALPEPLPGGRYRERFASMMGGHDGLDAAAIEGFFRAQAVWDATMSESVLRALERGHAPVVLVVGRFHVEHDGGVKQLLDRARPDARVLVVSMVESVDELEPGRGDVLVEVGPSPAR